MIRPVIFIIGLTALVGIFIMTVVNRSVTRPVRYSPGIIKNLLQLELTTHNGQVVRLAEYESKPLVINSWASWCPFCVKELVDFAKIQEEFKDKVVIIAINRAEKGSIARSFADNLDLKDSLVMLLDPDDKFYRLIGGFAMPETLFIDRDGTIVEHKRGPLTEADIRRKVKAILEE